MVTAAGNPVATALIAQSRAAGMAHEFDILTLDGALTGACGLNQISSLNKCCNLGYWARRSRRGVGAETAATLALGDFSLEQTCPENMQVMHRKERAMKFNIYGRFLVEVRRENAAWIVYRSELGKKSKLHDIVIPSDLPAQDVIVYLDDIFHELAGAGQYVERVPD